MPQVDREDRLSDPSESLAIRHTAAAIVGMLLAMVVVLLALGRVAWCSCGQYIPWSWTVKSLHNSQHLIDPYSFTHVLHGLVFFAVLWPLRGRLSAHVRLLIACLIEVAWEILENTPFIIDRYREATISLDYYGDSVANSVADVACCLLGYLIASRLRWYWSLALFVLVEVLLLATIRDSLALNVIMLIYPLDAILNWQSG